MLPIIEAKIVKTGMGDKFRNICLSKNGKEVVRNGMGYCYYNRKTNTVGYRLCKHI